MLGGGPHARAPVALIVGIGARRTAASPAVAATVARMSYNSVCSGNSGLARSPISGRAISLLRTVRCGSRSRRRQHERRPVRPRPASPRRPLPPALGRPTRARPAPPPRRSQPPRRRRPRPDLAGRSTARAGQRSRRCHSCPRAATRASAHTAFTVRPLTRADSAQSSCSGATLTIAPSRSPSLIQDRPTVHLHRDHLPFEPYRTPRRTRTPAWWYAAGVPERRTARGRPRQSRQHQSRPALLHLDRRYHIQGAGLEALCIASGTSCGFMSSRFVSTIDIGA